MPMHVVTAITLAMTVCQHSQGSTMEDVVRRFTIDRQSLQNYYEVPLSATVRTRLEAFRSEQSKNLDLVEFDKLDHDGKIDWVLLRRFLEAETRQSVAQSAKDAETLTVLPFATQIIVLEESRWTLDPVNPEEAAGVLDSIRKSAKEAQQRIEKSREEKKASVSPVVAMRAAKSLSGLRGTLKNWFEHYNGYKPLFTWWCQKPYDECSRALEAFEKFLRETVADQKGEDDDPLSGDPIGREALLSDLKREMIDYSPEELIKIAQAEYDWCFQELLKSTKEMGFGSDWKKAMDKVKSDHVGPGEQDDLVMFQGREAVKYVEDNDLVTLEPLCKETWRVEMLTASQQKNWPFAFYGGQHMATSYPLPEMDHMTKQMSMRGNNKHFLRAVTHHELIPGHHLQIYMADRYRSYRQVFSTPFFVEGWALHWEMLLWDLGFGQTPEDKIGMLFWRMHRCARIVVSLGFHLGKMTPEEMIDHLVEKVGHERFTATSEVRRYVGDMYSPLYQCAYLVGGLQLRGLYKELVPSTMTPKQFHDKVLRLGPIPMEMVRVSLKGVAIQKEFSGGRHVQQSFD